MTFVDDYAHLPGEVRVAVDAARGGGFDRIIAVFQPHRYSRVATLSTEFADSFEGADIVVITWVYAAGEAPRPGVSGKLVLDAILRAHPGARASYVASRDELVAHLRAILRPGDICLTLAAGDLTNLALRAGRGPAPMSARCRAASRAAIEQAAELLGPLAERDRPIGEFTTYRVGGRAALVLGAGHDRRPRAAGRGRRRQRRSRPRAREGFESPRRRRRLRRPVRAARRTASPRSRSTATSCAPAAPPPIRCWRGEARRRASRGMEWAVGIPGSVGGAVRMNAGGHGAETSDRLVVVPDRQPPARRGAGRARSWPRALLPPLVDRPRRRRDRGHLPSRSWRRRHVERSHRRDRPLAA